MVAREKKLLLIRDYGTGVAFETLKKERVVKRSGYFDAGCTFYLERGRREDRRVPFSLFPFCPLAVKSRGLLSSFRAPIANGLPLSMGLA